VRFAAKANCSEPRSRHRSHATENLSAEDMHKATNCFEPDLNVGSTIHINFCKATFDDHIVAIKAPRELKADTELVNLLSTEAATALLMTHITMIKLYGCCIEIHILILRYEVLPDVTLFRHLNGDIAFKRA